MSLRLFARFLRLYAASWLRSFSSEGRSMAPLSPQRLLILFVAFPAFLALQLLHWLGFVIDDLIFRGYRRVSLRDAVLITGLPRSGTTFVHRLLAADTQSFSSVATWEAVLAPSVSAKLAVRALARLDRLIGAPLQTAIRWLLRRTTASMQDIHGVDLSAPEEDYLLLLPAGGCFLTALAFPMQPDWWQLADFSRLPTRLKTDLLAFHQRCLKAHLYVRGRGRRLLSKNAAFASWLPALRTFYPNANFLLCIRDPIQGLSSQLSSIQPAHLAFAADPLGKTATRRFPTIFIRGYQSLLQEMESSSNAEERCVILDQDDLRMQSASLLRDALHHLRIPIGFSLECALRQQAAAEQNQPHHSRHHHQPAHFGIDLAAFAKIANPPYRKLRQRSLQTEPPTVP